MRFGSILTDKYEMWMNINRKYDMWGTVNRTCNDKNMFHCLFNRFAHSAGPGISVWRLGGMGSVRSGVSHRIGLLGWIGLFGWIGVFGWLAWLIWLIIFFEIGSFGSHICFIYF